MGKWSNVTNFFPDGLGQPPTSISWCRILEPSAIYQTVKVHQANWLRARAMGFHTSQLVTAGLPDYHLHREILRNNVSIYMFQIPDSNLVPSYCRWQGGCGDMFFFGGGVGRRTWHKQFVGKISMGTQLFPAFVSLFLFICLSKITILETKLTPENLTRIPWRNHQSGFAMAAVSCKQAPLLAPSIRVARIISFALCQRIANLHLLVSRLGFWGLGRFGWMGFELFFTFLYMVFEGFFRFVWWILYVSECPFGMFCMFVTRASSISVAKQIHHRAECGTWMWYPT